jgi:hypothetical protein
MWSGNMIKMIKKTIVNNAIEIILKLIDSIAKFQIKLEVDYSQIMTIDCGNFQIIHLEFLLDLQEGYQ